jgi:RND family efflux transporter MFP subunit
MARAALGRHEPLAQDREPSVGRPVGSLRLAIPFQGADGAQAAVAFEIQDAKAAEASPWIDRLRAGLASLVALERHHRAQNGLGIAVAALVAGLEPAGAHGSLLALATALAERFECERVAIGIRERTGIRLRALSRCAEIDPASSAARDLAQAMDEACDQDASVVYPPPAGGPPQVDRAHAALVARGGIGAAWTVPLPARGELLGAVTFECRAGRKHDPESIRCSEDVATLLGPLVALQRAAEAGPWARLREIASRRLGLAALGLDRRQLRMLLIGTGLSLLLAAIAPTPYDVRARARLEGRIERAIVAGVDGFLVEVVARPGDVVARHQLLARLDDRDLQVERRKWEGRREELRREHREALAEHDRAEASVLGARIAQAEAQLELVDATLARTELRAPFDGVVVRGDPTDTLGAPVAKSDVVYEMAPLDGYRVVVEVDEREIAHVAPGQRGRLALSALPGESLSFTVERVTPVAVAREGRNGFRVEAHLEQPSGSLRPGMEGVARIETARRSRLWIWGHGLVDAIRLAAWSWWP